MGKYEFNSQLFFFKAKPSLPHCSLPPSHDNTAIRPLDVAFPAHRTVGKTFLYIPPNLRYPVTETPSQTFTFPVSTDTSQRVFTLHSCQTSSPSRMRLTGVPQDLCTYSSLCWNQVSSPCLVWLTSTLPSSLGLAFPEASPGTAPPCLISFSTSPLCECGMQPVESDPLLKPRGMEKHAQGLAS